MSLNEPLESLRKALHQEIPEEKEIMALYELVKLAHLRVLTATIEKIKFDAEEKYNAAIKKQTEPLDDKIDLNGVSENLMSNSNQIHDSTYTNESINKSLNNKYCADLYMDCTGFSSLLLGKTLGVRYIDESENLPCNRAVAIPTHYKNPQEECHPYTKATTMKNGWRWTIPTYDRIGNGYVYSDAYCSKENAEKATAIKAQFLSTITHELRTPMYAVTGLTHLLLSENPTEEQKKHLDSLKFSGEYLLSLINNILDLNKLEANKVEVEE